MVLMVLSDGKVLIADMTVQHSFNSRVSSISTSSRFSMMHLVVTGTRDPRGT